MNVSFQVPAAEVIAWRRHIHANPEISFAEHRTAAYVHELLDSFGVETSRPTETSVMGVIVGTGTGRPGGVRCIALRADMDALPLQEETGLEFSSTVPGLMHACGHDTHTAMLLGTAKVLMGIRDRFAGTVKLLFQHAEEKNPGGARDMVAAGVLDGVDQVYGFHVMNGPKGTIQAARGNATSSAGGFFATITGIGCHGSMPDKGIDPVLCASQIVVALNHIVSRNIDPWDFTVVNPGFIASGAAPNVIPNSAELGCSIRTYTPKAAEIAYRRSAEVVEGICKAYNCTYELNWVPPYDIVRNDDHCVDVALAAARTIVGEANVKESGPGTGSEDFSEFSNRVPGCYVVLNGGDASEGFEFQNHHPKFDVHEDILEIGVATEVQIVLDVLGV